MDFLDIDVAVHRQDVVATWCPDSGMRFSRRQSDGSWSEPETIAGACGSSTRLLLAPNGMAVVVAQSRSGIRIWHRTAEGWSEPYRLDSGRTFSTAIDRHGVLTVAWARRHTVLLARRLPSGAWTPTEVVSRHATFFWNTDLTVATNARGDVAVAWPEWESAVLAVRPYDRARWRRTRLTAPFDAGRVSLAMDTRGRAVATWARDEEHEDWGRAHLAAATLRADGRWSPPRLLDVRDTPNVVGTQVRLSRYRRGKVVAVWITWAMNTPIQAFASTFRVTKEWQKPNPLGPARVGWFVGPVVASPSRAVVALLGSARGGMEWATQLPGADWSRHTLAGVFEPATAGSSRRVVALHLDNDNILAARVMDIP